MITRALFYTQPGCLRCELMRMVLEAKEVPFQEHDISTDLDARRVMTEEYDSTETPTLVVFSGAVVDVIVGFDPVRLDQFLDSAPSSDRVIAS